MPLSISHGLTLYFVRTFPQHLHFKQINNAIDLESIPAQLPLKRIAWERQESHVRRAGVSSFGFSGTNAHVILEEAPVAEAITIPKAIQEQLDQQSHVLIISAKTDSALVAQITDYLRYLKSTNEMIYNICYTSQIRHTYFEKQVAVQGKTLTELVLSLADKNFIAKTDMKKPLEYYADEIIPYLKRVSLPIYPFYRKSYWALSEKEKNDNNRGLKWLLQLVEEGKITPEEAADFLMKCNL